jgi:hypothetical protein
MVPSGRSLSDGSGAWGYRATPGSLRDVLYPLRWKARPPPPNPKAHPKTEGHGFSRATKMQLRRSLPCCRRQSEAAGVTTELLSPGAPSVRAFADGRVPLRHRTGPRGAFFARRVVRRERASGVTTELPSALGLHGTETILEGARLQPCHKQPASKTPTLLPQAGVKPEGRNDQIAFLKTTHNHNGWQAFTRKAFGWVSLPLTHLDAIAYKQKTDRTARYFAL